MTNSFKSIQPALVTVIIPNWNGMPWLPQCLIHLKQQSYQDFRIVVVDNGSTDESCQWIEENHPDIHLLKMNTNRGFAHAVNVGINASDTPFIALLNTDTQVHPEWLWHLVDRMQGADERLGAVSPLMLSLSQPDFIDDAGDLFSWYGNATKNHHGERRHSVTIDKNIFSPSGGASIYRRTFLDYCGSFDDAFFAYLEDVDLGLRGRLFGYRYELDSRAIVYHQGHGSKINRDRYLQLITQNRLLIFLKNIPLNLLFRNAGKIIYGQIFFLVANGRLLPVLKGYFSFLGKIPHAIRERRYSQRKIQLSMQQINDLLHSKKPGSIYLHLKKLSKINR